MKVVMIYDVAADGMAKARTNYPAHRARLDEFHARGVLLMAGPYANPCKEQWACSRAAKQPRSSFKEIPSS